MMLAMCEHMNTCKRTHAHTHACTHTPHTHTHTHTPLTGART
jgi:hypothetical protein